MVIVVHGKDVGHITMVTVDNKDGYGDDNEVKWL